eukprot:5155989-Amphidinium_carterae.1
MSTLCIGQTTKGTKATKAQPIHWQTACVLLSHTHTYTHTPSPSESDEPCKRSAMASGALPLRQDLRHPGSGG